MSDKFTDEALLLPMALHLVDLYFEVSERWLEASSEGNIAADKHEMIGLSVRCEEMRLKLRKAAALEGL